MGEEERPIRKSHHEAAKKVVAGEKNN